jgi:hypothetical protein
MWLTPAANAVGRAEAAVLLYKWQPQERAARVFAAIAMRRPLPVGDAIRKS